MADKITIPTQGTGDTTPDVATENVGAKHYQLMKLASGAPGSAVTIEGGSGTSAAALRVVQASDSPLPAGSNSIGTVSAGLLAGTASIGSVNVLALPAIPAGTNSIGSVNVLALPTLPAGTNSIGSVNVLALPTLPAGTNSIGSVNVLALPAVPAGANSIGTVSAQQLGTWTVQPGNTANTTAWLASLRPATSGGLTTHHLVASGSTNRTSVKASAGQLYGWYIYNNASSMRKVAFHNTSGTPTEGTSIYFSLPIPASSGANVFSEQGIPFSSGIAYTTVTGIADNDTAAVSANDLTINLWYS